MAPTARAFHLPSSRVLRSDCDRRSMLVDEIDAKAEEANTPEGSMDERDAGEAETTISTRPHAATDDILVHPLLRNARSTTDPAVLRDLDLAVQDDQGPDSLPRRSPVRRSVSCDVYAHPRRTVRNHHIVIGYRDEKLRERCQLNTQQLLRAATDEAMASTNRAILAKKALKYRHIYERTEGANLQDPSFDLSAYLGVRWRHVARSPPETLVEPH